MACKNCLDGIICQNKCVRPDNAKHRRIQEMKEYSREVDEDDDEEVTELTEFQKGFWGNVKKNIGKDILEWTFTVERQKEDKE